MKFWDASAIVPLLMKQETSDAAVRLYRADSQVIVWWCTQTECESAISRLERDELLDPIATRRAYSRLDALRESFHEVTPSSAVRDHARRMLRSYALRAADALQLAAARVASDDRPAHLAFVCLDRRLSLAAEREGFTVYPEDS